MAKPPHILIAGAGYAGLAACLALGPALRDGEVAVTVVNADDRHLLLPELPLYLSGETGAAQVRLKLGDAIRPPARLRVATIERVDPAGPALVCGTEAGRLEADGVLLALGSVSDDFGVPGVREHATAIGRWDDIAELRRQLLDDLHSQARSVLAVVGGGFTGVEVASELAERARTARSGLRVRLVAGSILGHMPPEVQRTASEALRQLGVEVVAGRAEAVESGAVRLVGGRRVEAESIVWAAGVRAHPVVARCGLPVNARGQLRVDAGLRAAKGLFAAGDCAELHEQGSDRPAAPTAQAALQSGPAAARNLLRELRGGEPEPFVLKERGVLVSLGRREAAGEIGARAVQGGEVAVLKRLLETYHAYQVGGLRALGLRLLRQARESRPQAAARR